MKLHPDRNPDDPEAEEKFKEVQGSVRGAVRRAEARHLRSVRPRGPARARRRRQLACSASDAFSDIFGDVFGDIFGGGRRGGRQQVFRGADLRYDLELDLEQAVFGHSDHVEFPALKPTCDACQGSGASPGSKPVTCDDLQRRRSGRASQQGFFAVQQTCPRCSGARRRSSDSRATPAWARAACARTRHSIIKVPPGVDNGDRIRLARRGRSRAQRRSAGRSVRRHLACKAHPIFERDRPVT